MGRAGTVSARRQSWRCGHGPAWHRLLGWAPVARSAGGRLTMGHCSPAAAVVLPAASSNAATQRGYRHELQGLQNNL